MFEQSLGWYSSFFSRDPNGYGCVSPMSARRLFLQSLNDSSAVSGRERPIQPDLGNRRQYLARLGGSSSSRPSTNVAGSADPTESTAGVVSFDLKSVSSFSDSAKAVGSTEKKVFRPKRPNYDNSRREMFANPEVRIK